MQRQHEGEEPNPPWRQPAAKSGCRSSRLWLLLLMPLCLCPMIYCGGIFLPDWAGVLITGFTKYANSEEVYSEPESGQGNSNWATHYDIYWSADPMSQIQTHYERFYGQFELNDSGTAAFRTQHYPIFTPLLYLYGDFANFSVQINLYTADQEERSRLICCYFNENRDQILDNLPRTGTIIIISYQVLQF